MAKCPSCKEVTGPDHILHHAGNCKAVRDWARAEKEMYEAEARRMQDRD